MGVKEGGGGSFLGIGSIGSISTFILLFLLGSMGSSTGSQDETTQFWTIHGTLLNICTHHLDSPHHLRGVHTSKSRHVGVHSSISSQLIGVLHHFFVCSLEGESLPGHSICLSLLHFL
ncbi:hypothetical protein PENTCL1PPCAC_22432 [Pristionchus entomophagus]|uniref:Uncharacterized protein n=1 Tax=Pristionchus entomophagus TaxID=358040 RepID=A0AAV5U116_9BILA|nr:hypothetical protein PENTCL1PPCAC_22432 [Pristionchus entomophagus]